jgi:hypothetical protein
MDGSPQGSSEWVLAKSFAGRPCAAACLRGNAENKKAETKIISTLRFPNFRSWLFDFIILAFWCFNHVRHRCHFCLR